MAERIARLVLFSLMMTAAAALVVTPAAQDRFDPFASIPALVLPGRIQNLVADDQFVVVHLDLGPRSQEIRVYAEPDLHLAWSKAFVSIDRDIVLFSDRIAFVGAETEPTTASVGLHIFNAATGARISYARTGLQDHTTRFLATPRDAIVDMVNGSSVFGATPAKFFDYRAVIGDKVLGIFSDRPDRTGRKAVLYNPSLGTDVWTGKTIAPEVLEFLDTRVDRLPNLHFDGFPVLLAETPRTKSDRPFQFLLLKENGEGIFLNRASFGLQDATSYASVDFAYTRPAPDAPSGRVLVAGINTRNLSPRDGEKMIIGCFDAGGAKLGQAEINLKDNSIAWTGIGPSGNLLAYLNQWRPREKNLITAFALPGLARTDVECAFDASGNEPPGLIDSELFMWCRLHRYPPGAPVPPRANMMIRAVVGVDPQTAGVHRFYTFDDSRWALMDYLKDRGRHVFNAAHIFLPFADAADFRSGALVLPIPRSAAGWLNASLSVPPPVYVDSDVVVQYTPGGAAVTVDLGRLDGVKWHTPSQPATAQFTVAFGTVSETFTVQVLARPVNAPPVASFVLQDKIPDAPWGTEAGFDGRASSDADGKIVSYAWDFNDGSPVTTGTDSSARHTFRDPGHYAVALTVTDDKGATGTVRKPIVIGRTLNINGASYGVPPALGTYNLVGYDVQITTGDVDDAGTNAKVYLALYGPKNAAGERQGTGEMGFDNYMDRTYKHPYDRGHTDEFRMKVGELDDMGVYSSVDEVEYLAIRHDNTGGNADWYLQSVRIRNQSNGKEWSFEPNCWLDFGRPPLRTVMGLFRPVAPSYLRGILFGGTPKCWDMTSPGDNIYILNAGSGQFYFTMLDRSLELDVFLNDVMVGRQYARGSGLAAPPAIPQAEWGVGYDVAAITKPTKFRARVVRPDQTFEETYLWVFPSNWKGFPALAQSAAVIGGFKGALSALNYGDTIRQFMKDQATFENYLAAALQPVINFGAESMGIFGMPTEVSLSGTIQERVGLYVSQGLNYALKALGMTLANSIIGETIDLFKSIIAAREWGNQVAGVTASGAAAAGGLYLLGQMADCSINLREASFLLGVIKTKMESAAARIEANDPAGYAQAMAAVKMIALGRNPNSANPSDYVIDYGTYGITDMNTTPNDNYCLSMTCLLEYNNIQRWKTDDYVPCYPSDLLIPPSVADMKAESKEAMKTYEPLFKNLMMIAGAIIDFALLL
jgi:PKD repeat protein